MLTITRKIAPITNNKNTGIKNTTGHNRHQVMQTSRRTIPTQSHRMLGNNYSKSLQRFRTLPLKSSDTRCTTEPTERV